MRMKSSAFSGTRLKQVNPISSERSEYRADRSVIESYEWRVDRIPLPDGRFGVVCYFRDISERKRAEHSANLLASIVESSEDAIVSKVLMASS